MTKAAASSQALRSSGIPAPGRCILSPMGRGGSEDGQELLYGRRRRAVPRTNSIGPPSPERVFHLNLEIVLFNQDYLEEEAESILPGNQMVFADPSRLLLQLFLAHPESPPGTEVIKSDSGRVAGKPRSATYYVSGLIKVTDPGALAKFAQARYRACYGDPDWRPDNLAEAIEEAFVASNVLPSPDTLGIEIYHSSVRPVEKGT